LDDHGSTSRAAPSVLGVGELLWDLFPDGPRLGGAPFNVTANLRRLGHRAAFVTAVGDDELGRAALAAADKLDVDVTFIARALDLPTGTVEVIPDRGADHRFSIRSPAAYESIGDGDALVERIRTWGPGALVFGTLAQRFDGVRQLTRRIASEMRPPHRLYDVNLRDGSWTRTLVLDLLGDATIVKVNEEEAETLAGLLGVSSDTGVLGPSLAARFDTAVLCITRGARGASLWADREEWSEEGLPIDVVDTVGAGDAFAAGLLHGLLTEMALGDTLSLANRLGSLVASRPGALPTWRLDEVV
jgi:fructokinase